MFDFLPTPTVLVDLDRLTGNIERMQKTCDANGVDLWPHIKTHKTVEIARMQLDAGAKGLTCAKLGEAEALLQSGVRRIFLAHSLVDPLQGPRLRSLAESLDELIVAVTSAAQAEALERVLASVDLTLPVLLAVDTGLRREGVRDVESARHLAERLSQLPHLRLRGIYSHEGHAYGATREASDALVGDIHSRLTAFRVGIGIDPALPLWPGCSVSAARMAALPGVTVIRPGSYVFGDLSLASRHALMDWSDLALTVLATVVDRPDPDLALLDAGSKTFSSDKTAEGIGGSLYDRRDIHVTKCSEEHGWMTGSETDGLRVGERVRVVPAHVCPVVNLTDELTVIKDGLVVDRWRVAARGKVQ
jgi:D-serine deaminase-like pyridoxal phosphate-dependent protein